MTTDPGETYIDYQRRVEEAIQMPEQQNPGVLLATICRFTGLVPTYVHYGGRVEATLAWLLAMTLGLTVSLAFMYGSISWSLFRTGELTPSLGMIIAGLATALAIYVLDRALLELIKRPFKFAENRDKLESAGPAQNGGYVSLLLRTIVALATRMGVAALIALIVSEPILLIFFEEDIDEVLQAKREDDLSKIIDQIDNEFVPRFGVELPSESDQVVLLRASINTTMASNQVLTTDLSNAEEDVRNRSALAGCERDGLQNSVCQSELRPGDFGLSGKQPCDTLCEGYFRQAQAARENVIAINLKIAAIPAQLSLLEEQLVTAVGAQRIDTLGFALPEVDTQGIAVPGGRQFQVQSPEYAEYECAVAREKMIHNTLPPDDSRSLALFAYCGINLSDIENTRPPRSGLGPRIDAFDVLTQCSDPLGFRSQTVIVGEPYYCGILSGSQANRTSSDADDSDQRGFFRQLIMPFEAAVIVPDSSLGRTAARIRWLLIILDTLPLIFKLGLSWRPDRGYDAIVALDRHHHLKGVQLARLSHDRITRESRNRLRAIFDRIPLGGNRLSRSVSGLLGRRSQKPTTDSPTSNIAEVRPTPNGTSYDDVPDPLTQEKGEPDAPEN